VQPRLEALRPWRLPRLRAIDVQVQAETCLEFGVEPAADSAAFFETKRNGGSRGGGGRIVTPPSVLLRTAALLRKLRLPTPLHAACRLGYTAWAEQLLRDGADVNCSSPVSPPVCSASSRGRHAV
jgi:hypothetical protein